MTRLTSVGMAGAMAAAMMKKETGQPTARLPIVLLGDNDVLHQTCKEVTEFGDRLSWLMSDLKQALTLSAIPGLGIAAPQIGVPVRASLIHAPDDGVRDLFLFNPRVTNRKGSRLVMEGCLSVPEYWIHKQRSEQVTVTYQDSLGVSHEITATGLVAQCLEHEIDHLHGVLFCDGYSRQVSRAARRAVFDFKRRASA